MFYHNPNKIKNIILEAGNIDSIDAILQKAINFYPLLLTDIAILLKAINYEFQYNKIINTAKILRQRLFGNSVRIYVPVYISNVCMNNCTYCAFRNDNKLLMRSTLSLYDFENEIKYLISIGHRTFELVLGFDPHLKGTQLANYIEIIRKLLDKAGGGTIILMSAPLTIDDYRICYNSGVDEVYSWLETYDKDINDKVFPLGTRKRNIEKRLQVFDNILMAGFRKIGMGILFGLGLWEEEVLSLLNHAIYLRQNYRIEPYAFGVPRFKQVTHIPLKYPINFIDDRQYKLTVAIYRIAFPYTHTYMNTRENINLLLDLLRSGGTEINAEASTFPGGYFLNKSEVSKQFSHYSYDLKFIGDLLKNENYEFTFKH